MNPPPTLVLGTGNPGKAAEFRILLARSGWRLVDLSAFTDLPRVDEQGSSYAENAAAKASELAAHLDQWVLADDTGLEVDPLNGAPGIRTARYAGPGATPQSNRGKLLDELADVPPGRRTARFVCALALADPAGAIRATAKGHLRGRIRREPAGSGGFGYDGLFEIVEYHRTLAELGDVARAWLSHRGSAVGRLLRRLRECLTR
jgi:XTP/dITP diphosphohydrolase